MEHKICRGCEQELPLTFFAKHPLSPDGLRYKCRDCWNKYQRDRRAAGKGPSKAAMREYTLKKKYGIDQKEWDQLWEKQGRGCAVCGSTTRPCVDHCHETGKIRGILCTPCNSAIGTLGDNLQSLRKVVEYLESVDRGE